MEDKNVTLISDQVNDANSTLAGSAMTKAGRLAMELSHEKRRLKQELEELQTEYDDIKPTTPRAHLIGMLNGCQCYLLWRVFF